MPIRVQTPDGVAEFPDGTDPAVIQSALQRQFGGADAEPQSAGSGSDLGSQAKEFAQRVEAGGRTHNLSRDLSMAAGIAAGPGILLPAIASGGAYFLGERVQGKDRAEAAMEGLKEGATGAAVGAGLKLAAGPVKRLLDTSALRWVKGGLKAPLKYLEHMAGAGTEGADAMEDRIAQTVLDSGVNPMRAGNTARGTGARGLQRQIEETAQARKAAIAAAPNTPDPGSGRRALNATFPIQRARTAQTDPTKDIRQIRRVREGMVNHPLYGVDPQNPKAGLPDLTPQQLADAVEADNRVLAESFGGMPEQARLDAIKAVRGQRAADLDRVAGTKDISRKMRDLIDVRNVADLARQRAGKRDVVGITDVISLSAGRPEVLAATTLMRPSVQVGTGRALSKAGKTLTDVDKNAALREILRALLGEGRLAVSHEQE